MALKVVIDAADKRVKDMIDEVTNGLEAFEAVKKANQKGFSYGLIFMDCSMPIMDGYTATEKIRKYLKSKFIQQPMIIACTGHSEAQYIKKAFEHKMDEVVPKPANIEVIKCILSEIV